jgi:hypothetical protein
MHFTSPAICALDGSRTHNHLIRSQALYPLSYEGGAFILAWPNKCVNQHTSDQRSGAGISVWRQVMLYGLGTRTPACGSIWLAAKFDRWRARSYNDLDVTSF